MQIVIEIPEEIRVAITRMGLSRIPEEMQKKVDSAIQRGTPLPKGHGALKDSDLLDARLNFVLNHTGGYKNTPTGTGIVIAMAENLDAPTIIEADKEQTDNEKTD